MAENCPESRSASLKYWQDRWLPQETASVALASWCQVSVSGAVVSLTVAVWVCPSESHPYPHSSGYCDMK